MNKHFEDRMEFMTQVIKDRIEESSSSDECQIKGNEKTNKRTYLDVFKERKACYKRRKYMDNESWIKEDKREKRDRKEKREKREIREIMKGSKRRYADVEIQEKEVISRNFGTKERFTMERKVDWKKIIQLKNFQNESSDDEVLVDLNLI